MRLDHLLSKEKVRVACAVWFLIKGSTGFPVSMRLLETPVPIPNTTVKRKTAEGTMLVTAWENRRAPDYYGGVAQLGEHLPCKQGVKSSNLSISTLHLENRIQNEYSILEYLDIRGDTTQVVSKI